MRKSLTKIFWNIEVWAVQKHVNLVDLVKSFPTNIFNYFVAKFGVDTEENEPYKVCSFGWKSEKDSISNLSTKEVTAVRVDRRCRTGVEVVVSSVLCATKKGFDVPSEQRLIEALRRLRPELGPTLHIFAWIIVVRILRLAKKTRLLLT